MKPDNEPVLDRFPTQEDLDGVDCLAPMDDVHDDGWGPDDVETE